MVNTSGETGGAAIAARRLMGALNNNGARAMMLVARKERDDISVAGLPSRRLHQWHFLSERLGVFLRQGLSKDHLFDIDPATHGTDITTMPEFKEADIIHLHWINQGFLSMKSLAKVLRSGKPVVWTMHDMWTFTGICHYTRGCERYKEGCGDCPLLRHRGGNDLSHKVWRRKEALWRQHPSLTFVGCSEWLTDMARHSALLRDHQVTSIVNAIDTKLYAPRDKKEVRQRLGLPDDRCLLLFCAYNVTLPIKGLEYLRQAIAMLTEKDPTLRDRLGLIMAGKGSEEMAGQMPVKTYAMGFVTDEHQRALIYNAADIFVIPSLQDNLPNTIVEAKASGMPVVATRVGGIPQMVNDHDDGLLVNAQDAGALAEALGRMLADADLQAMATRSRQNALAQYSESAVARRYMDLYENLLAHNTNRP